jgi:hypothetical protein
MHNPNMLQYPQPTKGADIVAEPEKVNEIMHDDEVYITIQRAMVVSGLKRAQVYNHIGVDWQAITIGGKTFVRLTDAEDHIKQTHKKD